MSSGLAEVASSWSADGRSVYVLSTRSGQPEIWRLAVDADRAPERITQGGGSQAFESPDGRWLYFTTGTDNSSVLRRALPTGPDTVLEKVGRVRKGYWAVSGAGIHRIFDDPEHMRGFVLVEPETGKKTEILLHEKGDLVLGLSVNAGGDVVFDVNGHREQDLFAVDLRPRAVFRIGVLRVGWPLW